MSPFLCPGGTIRIHGFEWGRIRHGDIVVFREKGKLIAHRLLVKFSIGSLKICYQKGDMTVRGYWVPHDRIAGVVTSAWDRHGSRTYFRDDAISVLRNISRRQLLRVFALPARRTLLLARRVFGNR